MFRVSVDVSLFTATEAFGRISGQISVAVIPQIGDHISFNFPERNQESSTATLSPRILKVTERIISANSDEEIILSLGDITVETGNDARKVMGFLEEAYGLFGEPYGTEE
jgi:hypothetical protein